MGSERLKKTSMGSVEVFIKEYDATSMDLKTDAGVKALIQELMDELNRWGYTKGGATISYAPETFEDSDDLGFVKINMVTKEVVKMNLGTMVYNGKTLTEMCPTARESYDEDKKLRIVRIGGLSNQKNTIFVLLAVHKDKVNGNTYNIIVGKNIGGFSFEYKQSDTNVFNCEFTAEPMDDSGTLYIYAEDVVGETIPEDVTPTSETSGEPAGEETGGTTEAP